MAQYRAIWKELSTNTDIAELSLEERYFYVLLIIHADDDGRMKANPKFLKATLFPFDFTLRLDSLETWLLKLENLGILLRYLVDRVEYLQHPNWKKWQIIRKDRYKPSDCPPPDAGQPCDDQATTNGDVYRTIPYQTKPIKALSSKPDLVAPIVYLNEKARRKYDVKNVSTLRLVQARLNEGRTIEDFKKVIDKKCAQWLIDEKMISYLRPSTLFNATNFENYLNEPEARSSNFSEAEEMLNAARNKKL